MKVVHTIKDLQAELTALRAQGKKVGLVPTMGALHAGHASLVKRSVSENGVTVVSVFVNPTQFNDKNDLEKYPRTLDADCRLLEECGADFAFSPSVSEMYPEPDTRQFSYAPLDTVMEGAFRPGHFSGVCQIVSKLFDAVLPDRAYFGQKDAQQLAVIKRMVKDLNMPLTITGCPIIREEDGLAKSSRNTYLLPEERKAALVLSRSIFLGKEMVEKGERDCKKILASMTAEIEKEPLAKIDYVKIVDLDTMQQVEKIDRGILAAIAVYIGKTRLIDNFMYELEN